MQKLKQIVTSLTDKVPFMNLTNNNTSATSVGWHIEHSLLTINTIISAVEKSNPDSYTSKFNLRKSLIFTLNKIPRGRAKAPKVVQPKNNFTTETLFKHITVTLERLEKLNTFNSNHYFEHPFFGNLNLKETIQFLIIHTTHHTKIIDDIINTQQK